MRFRYVPAPLPKCAAAEVRGCRGARLPGCVAAGVRGCAGMRRRVGNLAARLNYFDLCLSELP